MLNDESLEAYRAQTARLEELTAFAGRFTSAYGAQIKSEDQAFDRASIDDETPVPVKRARDDAVKAAFEAARRIALNS